MSLNKYIQKIEELFPEMVEWRRHLHMNPELSFQEFKTTQFIYDKLLNWGIKSKKSKNDHGVIGTIEGSKPGPTVALRADIDALPIQDQKNVNYASQKHNIMHACGHDGHTSSLLAIAKILQENRSELNGNIRLIFQPAEERHPGGALNMIENGALDNVDVIYGVHLWTPLQTGIVSSIAGPFMASVDEFEIHIEGEGGHAGLPHETVDSTYIGAQLVVQLQSIVSRMVNPLDPAVVSVGSFHSGNSFNVISSLCTINGTVRTFSDEIRAHIQKRFTHICEQVGIMYGAKIKLNYFNGYPTVVNHEEETNRFFNVGKKDLMNLKIISSPLIMAGEDFSYYLKKVPGCFMFVGAGNEDTGMTYPHHHPKFDFDESAMRNAVQLLLGMTLDYMYVN
ncbi:amidohydrolase [Chengkuizengella sediminis]|uniref:amidohydrolase n=1 Tax=Chengkuizengella sediminis TaxID=1885917 RepID=UPI00138A434D|nr:amidohydrolase [Chengkuizengella sediminis]NDI33503.1 amidohydrolase [Chengkuizengella sediminis]